MFHPDAYEFLKMALRFTVHNTPRMNNDESAEQSPPEPGVPDESQHVTGQELLEGIRRYALEQFGLMTTWVFQHWGIDTTEDWGRMVFELIDRGEMYKTEHDQLSGCHGRRQRPGPRADRHELRRRRHGTLQPCQRHHRARLAIDHT